MRSEVDPQLQENKAKKLIKPQVRQSLNKFSIDQTDSDLNKKENSQIF
jgi:hypothetical protein